MGDPFPAVSVVDNDLQEIAVDHKNEFYKVNGKPYLNNQYGRGPVLVSHPYKDRPAIWRIHTNGRSFKLSVYPHRKGNSRIEVWAKGQRVLNKEINNHSWHDYNLSLPSGTKDVELRHYATGWYWEELYFSILGP